MSYKVRDLVQARKLGAGKRASATVRKAVLSIMASYASDDGTGIWAAHETLAAEVECTDRAVRHCLAEFEAEELIRRDGKRGRAVLWRIDLDKLKALPPSIDPNRSPSRRLGELRNDVPSIAEPRSAETRNDVPTNLSVEPVIEPKRAIADAMAATNAAAACSAAPIDEWAEGYLPEGGLPAAVEFISEGFEAILSPKLTLAEWGEDLAELFAEGADFHVIENGMRSFLRTHELRQHRDARWEPLRRPLRHPVARQRILAETNSRFDPLDGQRIAGPSPPLKYGRSGAPDIIPATKNQILSDRAGFRIAADTPDQILWGSL